MNAAHINAACVCNPTALLLVMYFCTCNSRVACRGTYLVSKSSSLLGPMRVDLTTSLQVDDA
eukprot:3882105-Amphidinium_carterae.1